MFPHHKDVVSVAPPNQTLQVFFSSRESKDFTIIDGLILVLATVPLNSLNRVIMLTDVIFYNTFC